MWSVVHAVVCKLAAEAIFKIVKAVYRHLKAKEKSGTCKNQTRES